jgi:crotonobetainyl-CoA:carnitine CoA-transferase CaiB-like acyl-CoA transferase
VEGNPFSRGPGLRAAAPTGSADWDWRLDPIPALGEHTDAVLRELGFSTGELSAMRTAGVIGGPPAGGR